MTVAGVYKGANSWTVTSKSTSLALSSAITLTGATATITDNGTIAATFTGTLAIGTSTGTVTVTGAYNGANSWTLTSTAASLALSSSITLQSATVTITDKGTIAASFTGTLSFGALGSVTLVGTYLDATDWSAAVTTGTLGVAGGVQLTNVTAYVCDMTGTTVPSGLSAQCTLPGVADSGGSVTTNFAGTLSFATLGSVTLTGTYVNAKTWSFALTGGTLGAAGGVQLTNVTAYVCDMMGTTVPTALVGCTAPAKANSSGSVTVNFAGDLSFGVLGSVTLVGTYLDATDWSAAVTTGTLGVAGGVQLTNVTAYVCDMTGTTVPKTLTGCTAPAQANAAGTITAIVSGTLTIGSDTITASGTYLGKYNWRLFVYGPSLKLATGITLDKTSVTITATPPTGNATTGTIAASFSGTLTIGSYGTANTVMVSGNFLGSDNWSLDAVSSNLKFSSGIGLTAVQVYVCDQPTSGTVAAPPTLITPTGVTALACPSPTGAPTVTFSGVLAIGSDSIQVVGTYLGSTNWALAAVAGKLNLSVGTISLTSAQVYVCDQPTSGTVAAPTTLITPTGVTALACPSPTGTVAVSFSGLLAVGSDSVQVTGTYLSSTNWAIDAFDANLQLSTAISLTDTQVYVCDQPTTGTTATAPALTLVGGVTALACPTATGAVTVTFSGLLTVGSDVIQVTGTYLSSTNWALDAVATNLQVSSSISLSSVQVYVCDQPTSGTVAAPPTLAVPTGATFMPCPAATGAVAATFSGILAIGSGTIEVVGSYLGSGNWALAAVAANLKLTASISLTNAQVFVCDQPTSGAIAFPPPLTLPAGVAALACPARTGAVTVTFSGTLAIGSDSIQVAGSYLGSRNWALAAVASNLNLTPGISLTTVQVYVCDQPTTGTGPTATPPTLVIPKGTVAFSCPSPTDGVAVAFSGTLAIGSGSLTVSGSYLARNNWSVTVSSQSLTLTPGIVLASASATIAEAPTGSSASVGKVTATFFGDLKIGSVAITISGSYLDSSDWSVTASVSSIDLGSGFAITSASATACDTTNGTVSAALSALCPTGGTGGVTVSFTGTFQFESVNVVVSGSYLGPKSWTLTATSLTTLSLPSGVTLSSPTITIASKTTGVSVTVGGTLTFGSSTVVVSGSFTSAKVWSISGSLSSISLGDGVSISAFTLTVGDTATGPTGSFTGTLNIANPAINLTLAGNYVDASNWSLTASSKGTFTVIGLSLKAPSITLNDVAGTISFGAAGLSAGTIEIAGTISLPADVTTNLGISALSGSLDFNTSTLAWTATLTATTGWKTTIGKVVLAFTSTSLSMSGTGVVFGSVTITESGSITMPTGTKGTSQTILASLSFGIGANGVTLTISGIAPQSTGSTPLPVWANAFGYGGFNIMTMTLSIGYSAGLPTIGFAGSAQLPQSLMQEIGGDGSALITVAANLSDTSPCAEFSLTPSTPGNNVLNLGHGVLTASLVQFGIAPFGCTIGSGASAFVMAAGIDIAFTGSVLGTTVVASLAVTFTTAAVPTFTIKGSIAIGAVQIGALSLGASTIKLSLTTAPGGTESFSFSTSGSLLGVSATTSMSATYTLGTLTGSVMMTSAITNATIYGFGFKSISWTFDATTVGSPSFALAFSAVMSFDNNGDGISVTGSASSASGFSLTGTGVLHFAGIGANATLTAAVTFPGGVPTISASLDASISLFGFTSDATGSFTSGLVNGKYQITGSLTTTSEIKIGSLDMKGASLTLTLSPTGDALLYTFAPSFDGITFGQASLSVNAQTTGGTLTIGYVGSFAITAMTLPGGITWSGGSVTISNCNFGSGATCLSNYTLIPTFTLTIGAFTIPGFASYGPQTFTLASDLSFSKSLTGAYSVTTPNSGWMNLGLIHVYGQFSGTYTFVLSVGGSSSLSASFSGTAKIVAQAWKCNSTSLACLIPSNWGWGVSFTAFSGSVGLSTDGYLHASAYGASFTAGNNVAASSSGSAGSGVAGAYIVVASGVATDANGNIVGQDVWSFGDASSNGDWGSAIAAGTGPVIVQLGNCGWEMAWQGANGDLWKGGGGGCGSGKATDQGWGMAGGTSPSIASTNSDGHAYEISIVANTNQVYVQGDGSSILSGPINAYSCEGSTSSGCQGGTHNSAIACQDSSDGKIHDCMITWINQANGLLSFAWLTNGSKVSSQGIFGSGSYAANGTSPAMTGCGSDDYCVVVNAGAAVYWIAWKLQTFMQVGGASVGTPAITGIGGNGDVSPEAIAYQWSGNNHVYLRGVRYFNGGFQYIDPTNGSTADQNWFDVFDVGVGWPGTSVSISSVNPGTYVTAFVNSNNQLQTVGGVDTATAGANYVTPGSAIYPFAPLGPVSVHGTSGWIY